MTTTAPIPVAGELSAKQHPMPYTALLTLMAMSFLLVTSEFLPNGVLTEMAAGLGITTGQAGQTVSMTALAGLITALVVGSLFPRIDRRSLLIWMALLGAASNALVALAPSFWLILVARFMLGAALSTFWSMSISAASSLVGPARLGRALMFTSGGVSLATVAGVPAGVMLSNAFDWRVVFAIIGAAMLLLAVSLRATLPRIPAMKSGGFAALGRALRVPGVSLGLGGHVLVVLGHFAAYTYIRLALERVTDATGAPLTPATIVMLLAMFGAGGFIGNFVIGLVVDRAFKQLSMLAPVVIATAAFVVLAAPGALWAVGIAVTVWGFFFASWLLVVNTWAGHRLPDALEAGGSLVVVGFQGAIFLAAAGGGILSDAAGITTVYVAAIVILVCGSALFGVSHRGRQ
ncbi:MFS transporter [Leucobacter aridicollis]|uniref:MFS transporter n=1 Tax=Leucobacter aridicollis TaxID=283878 RepID=UPI0021056BE6|nr:MFS transporter [Leucobacter aridicollis]UTX53442.1 MFS transporter [Leucobacter aridicollis]